MLTMVIMTGGSDDGSGVGADDDNGSGVDNDADIFGVDTGNDDESCVDDDSSVDAKMMTMIWVLMLMMS